MSEFTVDASRPNTTHGTPPRSQHRRKIALRVSQILVGGAKVLLPTGWRPVTHRHSRHSDTGHTDARTRHRSASRPRTIREAKPKKHHDGSAHPCHESPPTHPQPGETTQACSRSRRPASSSRPAAPRLARTDARWLPTVRDEMSRQSLISRLVRPRAATVGEPSARPPVDTCSRLSSLALPNASVRRRPPRADLLPCRCPTPPFHVKHDRQTGAQCCDPPPLLADRQQHQVTPKPQPQDLSAGG